MDSQYRVKRKYTRKIPPITQDCHICGKSSRFKYYNVQSCESCKQFFRRIVLKQKDFFCILSQKCDPTKDEKCRSCRLDKCLRVGMDPSMVHAKKSEKMVEFVKTLEKRRRDLIFNAADEKKHLGEVEACNNGSLEEEGSCESEWHSLPLYQGGIKGSVDSFDGNEQIEWKFEHQLLPSSINLSAGEGCIESLVRLVCNHRRIWGSATDFPAEYLFKYENLCDFLADPDNLLGRANEFSLESPPFWNKRGYIEMVEQFGFLFQEHIQLSINDAFLIMEFAKTMPFFRQLNFADQIGLLKHNLLPAMMFFNTFYSLGMNTWTRANGRTTIAPFIDSKRFGNDQKIRCMTIELFCNTVVAFRQSKITQEEFSLLLWLLFTNTVTDDISEAAKSMLYDESVRISGILMRMLHRDHGHFEGSKRFAAAINLLNTAYKFKYTSKCLLVYLDVFHVKRDASLMFPKVQSILWNQC